MDRSKLDRGERVKMKEDKTEMTKIGQGHCGLRLLAGMVLRTLGCGNGLWIPMVLMKLCCGQWVRDRD